MENATETTFKDLQTDERFKRLERTLKMVLLKNPEIRATNNIDSSAWPSISSINGDNLDTSCAAMSVRSSRMGSEVVSSSMNLRNLMLHKQRSLALGNKMVTSSENQYPMSKNNDSVMMPPPRTPVPSSLRSKRSSAENGRAPLLNVSMNMNGENDFAQSTPSGDVTSIPKCPQSLERNSVLVAVDKNDYRLAGANEESSRDARAAKSRERSFTRWRVLLNDKAQLIIKGTLECGKIARSKPVIRRLDAGSVESIFKHTYRLQGNLVDERNELPDYVSGKFYNGFPDDWENVCQIWRNFVNNGSRLSFRWPTPISDSDDEIKTEITEISYRPRYENTKISPRKRARSSKQLSPFSSPIANNEKNFDESRCNCARVSVHPGGNSLENSSRSSENLTKSGRSDESVVADARIEKNKSFRDTNSSNFDRKRRVIGNSLKDIIQEDKLNIIIENLTNKNCSLDYIKKIVEMFDCMRYLVSYESTQSNDSAKYNEEISDRDDKSRCPIANSEDNEKRLIEISNKSNIMKKIDRPNDDARRKLTINDYEDSSSESESDYCDVRRKKFFDSRLREKIHKSQEFKDKLSRSFIKMKQRYRKSPRSIAESREAENFPAPLINGKIIDSSRLGEEKFRPNERTKRRKDSRDEASSSPKKFRETTRDFPDAGNPRDSSISITEDENEERCRELARISETRRENYDSSVSITEDERSDDRRIREKLEASKQRSPANLRLSDRPNSWKTSTNHVEPMTTIDEYHENGNDSTTTKSINDRTESNRIGSDFLSEHRENSTRTADVKSEKNDSRRGTIVEEKTNKTFTDEAANVDEPQRDSSTRHLTPMKGKILQTKKKPIVISSEIVNVDIRGYDLPCAKNVKDTSVDDESTIILHDRSAREAKSTSNDRTIATNRLPERAKIAAAKSARHETSEDVKDRREDDAKMRKTNLASVESAGIAEKSSIAIFGSEENPKKLTGWVPAVICDDDDGSECRLIFEGKLINEAGHVVNRKFTTDFVKRRLSPKLIETYDHVFYQLDGDLHDTKHVVPKDLVKLSRNGCPININNFCEKWKFLSSGNNENPRQQRSHNTSVDCLSVPKSSRGRRILPPLNYWTGERIATKGNEAVYSPGNSKQSSFTSSFGKINEEIIAAERRSPRARASRVANNEAREKLTDRSSANGAKKKSVDKISSPTAAKSFTKKASDTRGSRAMRSRKKKLTRKTEDSTSESDEGEKKRKIVLRKRKTRTNDQVQKIDTTSPRKLRNSGRNTTSSQSLEQSTSSRPNSFEKPDETEIKAKLRKRQKIDRDETKIFVAGASKRSTTRGSSEVTCSFYKNVPFHDGDLSEDQLSTI